MSNETIFREVDEELRSDRMRNLWKRFGPYVIGGAVAVVLLVAVNEGWAWWQNSNAARASDEFYAALTLADGTDSAAAKEAFDKVEASGVSGYAPLARFRQAGLLVKEGKTDEAIAAYDALSTSESNQQIKGLALIFAAELLVDNGDVAAVQQRVGGLAEAGNPLRNAAREALGLAQYKADDLEAARASFLEIIADSGATQELVGRIQIYVGQLASLGATGPTVEEINPATAAESVGEAPAMDTAPAMEAPAMEAPAMEAPAMEAPAMEAPAADAAPATTEGAA